MHLGYFFATYRIFDRWLLDLNGFIEDSYRIFHMMQPAIITSQRKDGSLSYCEVSIFGTPSQHRAFSAYHRDTQGIRLAQQRW